VIDDDAEAALREGGREGGREERKGRSDIGTCMHFPKWTDFQLVPFFLSSLPPSLPPSCSSSRRSGEIDGHVLTGEEDF